MDAIGWLAIKLKSQQHRQHSRAIIEKNTEKTRELDDKKIEFLFNETKGAKHSFFIRPAQSLTSGLYGYGIFVNRYSFLNERHKFKLEEILLVQA